MDQPIGHQFHRLPGLFRRWELGQIIEPGEGYRIEDAGKAADGTDLYSIYVAEQAQRPTGKRQAARCG